MEDKRKKKRKLPFTKAQAACVAGGMVLYAVMELSSGMGRQALFEGGGLKRAGPGQGDTSYEILVSGLDRENCEKKIPVKIPVRERRYTDEEAEELYDKIFPLLQEQILGENESLEEVRRNLDLKSSLSGYGFRIDWQSDDPELIDSFGTVHNEETLKEGETTWLKARLTDGSHERRYEFKVTIYPPAMTMEEKAVAAFESWAGQIDLRQQTKDILTLPQIYNGQSLTYYMPGDGDHRIYPVLGILLAALLHIKVKIDKQKRFKKRERQLLLDYSEVVSKLVVYIGAGLTVRGAWERIAAGYEKAVRQGKWSKRPAYEEMVKTANQLDSGLAEGRAFDEFGRRCGLQSYRKLSTLLEQGRKNGSRQLRTALELELVAAFEQRKNLAKKSGEEAGTRLLLPLLLMLGVVMVMIVVPAFLAFY